MTIFSPFSSRVPTNGLSFHAQLCSSKCLTTPGSSSSKRASLKRAVLGDALAGALQRARALDAAGGHEVVHFDEIAGRPRQPRGERFGVHFVAPLHAPHVPARVAHGHAREAAGAVLFDEVERRRRRAVASAGTGGEVEAFRRAGIAPDDRAPRRERRVAGRSPLHVRIVRARTRRRATSRRTRRRRCRAQ